ncbi:MAG: POTRA domain-containing protein, partial [Leptolyngbyaceae bacterium]|nr:POTRA domain-containing protein [Leptolyngbyaceae bacterium]
MKARQLCGIALTVLGIAPLDYAESGVNWGKPSYAFTLEVSDGVSRAIREMPDEQGSMIDLPAIALPTEAPSQPVQFYAQDRPNQPGRDRFLQPQPIIPGEQPVDLIPPPSPQLPPPPDDETVFEVQSITVVGSSVFAEDDERIVAIIQPLVNQPITFADLSRAAAEITGLYLEEGYITSRAIVEPQSINGSATIRVIEGEIERIDLNYTENSSQRLRQAYIRNRLNLGIETPLNVNNLEEQLRLLLADPLIENIEPTLEPGTGEGQSILTVLVTEADGFSGNVGVDNYTPPSIGSVRFGANLAYRNVTGIGDSIAASVFRTASGGSTIVDISYRAPVNPMNGTIQVGGQLNRNEMTTAPLDELDVDGESERIEISYRQPVVRSLREEFALSLGFSFQDGQTFVFDQPTPFGLGPDDDGISRTSVFRLGQDYVARDPGGA